MALSEIMCGPDLLLKYNDGGEWWGPQLHRKQQAKFAKNSKACLYLERCRYAAALGMFAEIQKRNRLAGLRVRQFVYAFVYL